MVITQECEGPLFPAPHSGVYFIVIGILVRL